MDVANVEVSLRQLVNRTYTLLGDIIKKTRDSDINAKRNKADWSERHRLQVLLAAAEATLKILPSGIVEPWFLSELAETIITIEKWSTNTNWKEIKPSLASPRHFTHTVAKLRIADHLERQGHKVEIVPRGKDSSPDLKVKAIGGREEWIFVECYQPKSLNGRRANLSASELKQVIKRTMKKAKEQIGEKMLGIMAITSFNQSEANLKILKRALQERLLKTKMSNIIGIMIVSFDIWAKRINRDITFIPIYSLDVVLNPSYFGSVDADIAKDQSDPRMIKEPMLDTDIANIINGKVEQIAKGLPKLDPTEASFSTISVKKPLKVIPAPEHGTRVVISRSTGSKRLPLFSGDGSVDFQCGECNCILVQCSWLYSISNIVLRCPLCNAYSEFPRVEVNHPVTGRIAMNPGEYASVEIGYLPRGICLIGLDTHMFFLNLSNNELRVNNQIF